MVELIVLAVVVFAVTLGVMYGVPRAVGGGRPDTGYDWPDVLAGLEGVQQRWFAMPSIVDIGAAVLTLLVLAAGISVFLDPSMIGAEPGTLLESLGLVLIVLGLALLGIVSYLRVRRAGVSNAEALLIGMTLTGTALMIVVLYVLVQQG